MAVDNSNYVEGARKRKEAKLKVSEDVDDFLAMRKEEIANFVPQEWKKRQLPSGGYEIHSDHGVIPQALSGTYTSDFHASKAISTYMAQKLS